MALPIPTTEEEWKDLAKSRIIRILGKRIAANNRQLEAKICESGPANKRPQPHILGKALKELVSRGLVRLFKPKGESFTEELKFYSLQSASREVVKTRVNELLVPYRLFRLLTDKNEYCSDVLEDIVRASFDAVPKCKYLGKLPPERPLDGVYQFGPYKIGVEVKNRREWIYPKSQEVRDTVLKCIDIDAVPFLVARKIHYYTNTKVQLLSYPLTEDAIGVLGFQVHRQVFSKKVDYYLKEIQDTDKLGYKDVTAVDVVPNLHLLNYLNQKLPDKLKDYYPKWKARRNCLVELKTRGFDYTKLIRPTITIQQAVQIRRVVKKYRTTEARELLKVRKKKSN